MSNLIFAAWREAGDALDEATLRRVADRIRPRGLERHAHHLTSGLRERLAIVGPQGAATSVGTSARVGAFSGTWKEWHLPGSPVPEGSFALIRANPSTVELCSDFPGSRTLWYVRTATHFFASTSQRALIALLGDLQLNRTAAAWFLSSGSLGPVDGWDTRISRLPGNARLTLDRTTWALEVDATPVAFHPRPARPADLRQELLELLRDTVGGFDFSTAHWAFPLSGGYDCRFILGALHDQGMRPHSITWGLAASLTQPGNDAYVAKALAAHYQLPHDYLLTEMSQEGPEAVVDAFLRASGGDTDQLFPYLDGLRLWSSLPERGIEGIIRGDEGFGWVPVKSEAYARSSVGMMLLSDFLPPTLAESISGGGQHLPPAFERQGAEESLACYRDRLYHTYRIPIGLAALNEVKAPFVEIASPLISRRILEFVRQMPDALRTEKHLFRQVAKSVSPGIPYATMSADDDRSGYLQSEAYSRWMEEELGSEVAHRLLPEAFRESLRHSLRRQPSSLSPTRSLRAALKRLIPTGWVRSFRAQMGPVVPSQRLLALRASLTARTVRMLEADARIGRS